MSIKPHGSGHITTLDRAEDFYESGRVFGNFQAMLADYSAETLHETIPDFHNTPKRYQDFERDGQNLDRCRTQLALVADMERKWEQMEVKKFLSNF